MGWLAVVAAVWIVLTSAVLAGYRLMERLVSRRQPPLEQDDDLYVDPAGPFGWMRGGK
jgi:hypothetical protein